MAQTDQSTAGIPPSQAKDHDPIQASNLAGTPPPGGTHSITLDVVVTDKSGQPVAGLLPEDFTLLDNKQKQSFVAFHQAGTADAKADPPVTVILLVDTVNEWYPVLSHESIEWQGLKEYFKANGGHLALPTSLIVLRSDGLRVENHPTRDGKLLADFLDANTGGLEKIDLRAGRREFANRSTASLMKLDFLGDSLRTVPGRKLILWLSLGWTDLNHFSSDPRKDDDLLFRFIATLSNELMDARITLYAIHPVGGGHGESDYRAWKSMALPGNLDYMSYFRGVYMSRLKGVESAKRASYDDILLPVIAMKTGGQVLQDENDLAKQIDRCLSDANGYYSLTFNAPVAAHPNEYHGIDVKMAKPGLDARTRSGYYAQP